MLMTAHELHELVKDVPKEAWPENCYFLDVYLTSQGWYKIPVQDPDSMILDNHIELLFVGSMTHYLIGEGHHSFNFVLGDDDVTLELYEKTFCVRLDIGSRVQTTTRLLAAACKAVAKENAQ
jgi:hypothetical protein